MHPNEALFANEAFYLAFAENDYSAMRSVWSQSEQIVCIHPGWPALTGREAVLESWKRILNHPEETADDRSEQLRISFYGARAVVIGSSVAVVCYEVLPGSVLTAMNMFVVEDGRPRLAHHQAGLCGNPPALDIDSRQLDA